MDDDFEFPAAGNMEIPEEEEVVDEMVSPVLKVGEEKEIGKEGLKKKLVKEGEGWDSPNAGDQVEGNPIQTNPFHHHHVLLFLHS